MKERKAKILETLPSGEEKSDLDQDIGKSLLLERVFLIKYFFSGIK